MDHADLPPQGTPHDPTAHHAAPAADHSYFSAGEWQGLRAEDITAGRRIVGLMFGIFIVGLFLYTGVAIWVLNRAVY